MGSALFVVFGYLTARRLAFQMPGEGAQPGSIDFYFAVLLDILIDSVVIGIGFALSTQAGMLLAVGMILHKIPLAFVTVATAKNQGLSRPPQNSLLPLFVGSILAGVILGFGLLHNQPDAVLFTLTVLASGFLITAVVQSMVPEAIRDSGSVLSPIFFTIGLTIYALLALVVE